MEEKQERFVLRSYHSIRSKVSSATDIKYQFRLGRRTSDNRGQQQLPADPWKFYGFDATRSFRNGPTAVP